MSAREDIERLAQAKQRDLSKYTSKKSSRENIHAEELPWLSSLLEQDVSARSENNMQSTFMSNRSTSNSSATKYGETKRSSASDVKDEDFSSLSSIMKEKMNLGDATTRASASSERQVSSSFATNRRSSDRILGSTGDSKGIAAAIEESESVSRPRSSREMRSRPGAINLFRDDFDDRMKDMIRRFDTRCSRSFWDDDVTDRRVDSIFDRETRNFEERARIINDRFFSASAGSFFDDDDDFFDRPSLLRNRRAVADFGEGDSGIFSDVTSRRHLTDDPFDLDRSAKHERLCAPEKFEVDIDVNGFKANELMVKTEGNRVVVCAKGKEVDEASGSKPSIESRELRREFDLPEDVDPYDVVSNLMPDGFLRVEAPLKSRRSTSQGQIASDSSKSTSYHYSSRSNAASGKQLNYH